MTNFTSPSQPNGSGELKNCHFTVVKSKYIYFIDVLWTAARQKSCVAAH